MVAFTAVFAALLVFNNCENIAVEGSVPDSQVSLSQSIFSDSNNEFIVKVVYEVGATPYTGTITMSCSCSPAERART